MKGLLRGFTLTGLNLERLLRQAGENDIRLMRLHRSGRRITGLADEEALARLANLAEKGGWRMDVGRRHGLGRAMDMLRQHWTLAAAMFFAALLAAVATQLMWGIDIQDAGVYLADIREYLAESGIAPLQWKRGVDTAALRDALEWRYPQIAWVECGWRGTTLKITVVEGVAQGETLSHNGSGDVVAGRDGVVEAIITVAGTAQVKAGDVVRKGQVLIRGEERTTGELLRKVAARGQVMARVWDGAVIRMSLYERDTTYTGRRQEVQNVVTPWFSLCQEAASPFEQQDVSRQETPLGGVFFPLQFRHETRLEAECSLRKRDMEQLKAEAGVAAMRKLRLKIGNNDDLVDKWVDYCMIEDEVLEAVAIGERLMDIAVQSRGNGP